MARREGVDLFRVLPNKTLEELAEKRPGDKAAFLEINGIKEAKFRKYGRDLLAIINGEENSRPFRIQRENLDYFKKEFLGKGGNSAEREEAASPLPGQREAEGAVSVGAYLDRINRNLLALGLARVRGEVSSVSERGNAVYFTLKDEMDESVINCLIFRREYDILGLRLAEGVRIIAEGRAEIYKPYGKLSFRAEVIELGGEGSLKKEYDKLKEKLEEEGFFAEEAKRRLERLPQRIGLITSRDGAAIGDFTSNIGQYGLRIRFVNSSVEGKRAVFELINAVRSFAKPDIDVLVIIRGGGSLESLQAFNNEALIRETKRIKVPVVCGVGHERDVSLLALAADYAVSTPTAAAKLIGGMWEKELGRLDQFENNILDNFAYAVSHADRRIQGFSSDIESDFRSILENTESRYGKFKDNALIRIEKSIGNAEEKLAEGWRDLTEGFGAALIRTRSAADGFENALKLNDPQRQLRLGYGIISKNGASIRSVGALRAGDTVKIRVFDGEARSEIKAIKKLKK